MAALSQARKVALALLGRRRRNDARVRDLARGDEELKGLQPLDRALAYRLVVGATAARQVLDAFVDERIKRPSSLEPRVRDALTLSAFEVCYLDTPSAVAVSQGVELVRSVAPRAAGLANAVLRRLVREIRPDVDAARERLAADGADARDLSLVSGLPRWLVDRMLEARGAEFARSCCLAQLEPAPVSVAANGLHLSAEELEQTLGEGGMGPRSLEGLPGAFALADPAPLAASGLIDRVDAVACDASAQLVCRIAAPAIPCGLLEVGQGRGTKSVLLATAVGAVHPTRIAGVDSVAYKVRLSRRRMDAAGLCERVSCTELDATTLADDGLPRELDQNFGVVLVDAPCSGTGTMRRHPEIASSLTSHDVSELADLQLRLLTAASARVAAGGTLIYSTCSVLPQEDEAVIDAFLESDEGCAFHVEPVSQAPACTADPALANLALSSQTHDGHLLTCPTIGGGDGHFCARLVRS